MNDTVQASATESTISFAAGNRQSALDAAAIFARPILYDLTIRSRFSRRGGERADAEDLKSSGAKAPCGFESRPRHKGRTY